LVISFQVWFLIYSQKAHSCTIDFVTIGLLQVWRSEASRNDFGLWSPHSDPGILEQNDCSNSLICSHLSVSIHLIMPFHMSFCYSHVTCFGQRE
jgi:hypothetical protein